MPNNLSQVARIISAALILGIFLSLLLTPTLLTIKAIFP